MRPKVWRIEKQHPHLWILKPYLFLVTVFFPVSNSLKFSLLLTQPAIDSTYIVRAEVVLRRLFRLYSRSCIIFHILMYFVPQFNTRLYYNYYLRTLLLIVLFADCVYLIELDIFIKTWFSNNSFNHLWVWDWPHNF